MKRFAKVVAFVALTAFILGMSAPAAYAETRRIDVTVEASDVNIFSYAYYFDSRKTQLDSLNRITVAVYVGGDKVKEAVLDKYSASRSFVVDTVKNGDIKIRLKLDWRDDSGPGYKEYVYTGPGQKIIVECADVDKLLPGIKYKTLMDPFSR